MNIYEEIQMRKATREEIGLLYGQNGA